MYDPAGIWPARGRGPSGANDTTGSPQSGAGAAAVVGVVGRRCAGAVSAWLADFAGVARADSQHREQPRPRRSRRRIVGAHRYSCSRWAIPRRHAIAATHARRRAAAGSTASSGNRACARSSESCVDCRLSAPRDVVSKSPNAAIGRAAPRGQHDRPVVVAAVVGVAHRRVAHEVGSNALPRGRRRRRRRARCSPRPTTVLNRSSNG